MILAFHITLTNIFYLALSQSELPMNNCINVNLIYIYSLILTLRWHNGLAHMTADNNIVRSIFYSYLFQ